MSFSHISNYRERYFEDKTLTKVTGLPTIDTILEVFRQLKQNAQSVPTTLGGGQFGYLFLVLIRLSVCSTTRCHSYHSPNGSRSLHSYSESNTTQYQNKSKSSFTTTSSFKFSVSSKVEKGK